jgi:NRAMP (natural resistance-associated macrophage protein)-like metal ion transporter
LNSLPLLALIGIFLASSVAIWFAGIHLARATDTIMERYGLGEALGGLVILSLVGNLPEAAIVFTASWNHQFDIAIGNILGSIAAQTLTVAILDEFGLGKKGSLTRRTGSLTVVLEAALVAGVLATSLIGATLPKELNLAGISPADIVTTTTWIVGVWLINRVRKTMSWEIKPIDADDTDKSDKDEGEQGQEDPSGQDENKQDEEQGEGKDEHKKDKNEGQSNMGRTWVVFAVTTVVTLVAGIFLVLSGSAAADQLGINGVVLGATFLSLVGALPEIATGIEAIRLGDYELSVSDAIGSNAILPVFFLPASLLAGVPVVTQVRSSDLYLIGLGILLTVIYVWGPIFRARRQILGMGIDSFVVVVLYVLGVVGLVFLPQQLCGGREPWRHFYNQERTTKQMAEPQKAIEVEPGMVVETVGGGDLGGDDLSKPQVEEVINDEAGNAKAIVVKKGILFKKEVEVPISRVVEVQPTSSTDEQPGTVKIALTEQETDALTPQGSEQLTPDADDLLTATEETLPTESGLRKLELERKRERTGETPAKPDTRPSLLRVLGPGFLAGIADNDSSSVTTYAVDGASVGYAHLWLMLLATPLLQAVQFAAARVGQAQQKGFAEVLREHYGLKLAVPSGVVLVLANLALITADLVAVGTGLELITGLPWPWFVAPVAVVMWYLVVYHSFEAIKKVFLVLSLTFITYLIAAVLSKPNWGEVLSNTFIPHLDFSFGSISSMVALLGATISPWIVYWQVQGEKEEKRPGSSPQEQRRWAALDIGTGVFSGNLVSYAIIVSTAATSFAQHQQVKTALDAARAFEPLLGSFAKYLFAVGLIGAGLVAIPILMASTSYAVAGTVGWPTGLSKKPWQAEGFYLIVTVTIVISVVVGLLGFNPLSLIFWANVLQGLLIPGLLIVLLLVANNRRVMGGERLGWPTNLGLALATLVTLAGAILLVYGLLTGQGGN